MADKTYELVGPGVWKVTPPEHGTPYQMEVERDSARKGFVVMIGSSGFFIADIEVEILSEIVRTKAHG